MRTGGKSSPSKSQLPTDSVWSLVSVYIIAELS